MAVWGIAFVKKPLARPQRVFVSIYVFSVNLFHLKSWKLVSASINHFAISPTRHREAGLCGNVIHFEVTMNKKEQLD